LRLSSVFLSSADYKEGDGAEQVYEKADGNPCPFIEVLHAFPDDFHYAINRQAYLHSHKRQQHYDNVGRQDEFVHFHPPLRIHFLDD
jgi:hypothetical protein